MKNQCKWSCLLCVEVRDAGRKNIASVFYPYHFEEDSYVFKEE